MSNPWNLDPPDRPIILPAPRGPARRRRATRCVCPACGSEVYDDAAGPAVGFVAAVVLAAALALLLALAVTSP